MEFVARETKIRRFIFNDFVARVTINTKEG